MWMRFLVALAATALLGDSSGGIRPRGSSSDYSARDTAGGVTLAATVIPPDQVKKLFATDLNKAGYIVVEVAIYPESGKPVNISSGDFLLQVGTEGAALRPVSSRTIASIFERKSDPPVAGRRGPDIMTSSTIGYESGRYDPNTGRRASGVYTASGVGIGDADPRGQLPPQQTGGGRDPRAIEQELDEKALPEGDARDAVAGYLYFPKPSGKAKNAPYQITFYGTQPKVHLTVPSSAK